MYYESKPLDFQFLVLHFIHGNLNLILKRFGIYPVVILRFIYIYMSIYNFHEHFAGDHKISVLMELVLKLINVNNSIKLKKCNCFMWVLSNSPFRSQSFCRQSVTGPQYWRINVSNNNRFYANVVRHFAVTTKNMLFDTVGLIFRKYFELPMTLFE